MLQDREKKGKLILLGMAQTELWQAEGIPDRGKMNTLDPNILSIPDDQDLFPDPQLQRPSNNSSY